MSTAFSRSMRSLAADDFRRSTWALLLAIALLGAWTGWLFLARISLYEVAETARLVSDRDIVADFAPAALGRIQPGQAARLRLDSFPWAQYGTLAASVTRVTPDADGQRVEVALVLRPDQAASIPVQQGLTGVVEVEVEQLSPAALVLRSAGQMLVAPGSTVAPR